MDVTRTAFDSATMTLISKRMDSIHRYVEMNGLESYDPYDGLSSPWSVVVGQNPLGLRIWQQSIRLLPINLRGLLGVPKLLHTKTVSDFASAYTWMAGRTQNSDYAVRAKRLLSVLSEMPSVSKRGKAWGLRFKFATRFITANPEEPNIFQTINAIHAFLDGYEYFRDASYLASAREGMDYLVHELGYVECKSGIYWNYWSGRSVVIYNVSGLMIGLCSRYGRIINDVTFCELSGRLAAFIYASQNKDGSWHYAEDRKGHFIDGYHTGYILEGLSRALEDNTIEEDERFVKGVHYYLATFFAEDRLPKYYHNALYPIDGQVVAQALQTLFFLRRRNLATDEWIRECFVNSDRLLWNPRGYYRYQVTKFIPRNTPMHRWVTGPMFLALSLYYAHLYQHE